MVAPGMQAVYFRVLCTFQYLIYYQTERVEKKEHLIIVDHLEC